MDENLCGVWDVSRDQYHADYTRVGHGGLQELERSVPYFYGRYVARTIPAPEPTPAMRFGTALHTLVLEPGTFEARHVVKPEGIDRRTKKGKEDWIEFEASACGREILERPDMLLLMAMREGIFRNPHARSALEADGHYERALAWPCIETGVLCKCLPDKLLDNGCILDLKTTTDPSPEQWSRTVAGFAYHCQAAHYLEGCWRAVRADGPFVFVVVSKEPPHECVCYTLDELALTRGRETNLRLLRELAERREKNNWASRWEADVQVTTLPRWAL